MRKFLWSVVRITLAVYIGLVLLYGVMQRDVLYYPSRSGAAVAAERARDLGFVQWLDGAGTAQGWRTGIVDPGARWVVFHGNAGSALDRDYFRDLIEVVDAERSPEVMLFEYPGYGAREGKPSEAAFFAAAVGAVTDLGTGVPVYLVGESIGSGSAAHVAGVLGERVAGLLLITPFDDLAGVALHHFPYLPVRWILRDRFRNAEALRGFHGPVAVVVAERDEVVPAKFGLALYEGYEGPGWFHEIQGATHNTMDYVPESGPWREAVEFLRSEGTP